MQIVCILTLLLVSVTDEPNLETAVEQLLQAHERGLAAVRSVELEYSVAVISSPDVPPEVMATGLWLMDGLLERHIENTDASYDAKGLRNSDGWVRLQFGFDDRQLRLVRFGNKEANLEKLVKSGVNAGDPNYSALKCSILPRDPVGTFRPVHNWFRRVVNPSTTLRQAVTAGRLIGVQSIGSDSVIEFVANDGGPVGEYVLRVFLDKTHAYAMRRTEYVIGTGDNLRKNVIEIDAFSGDESAWFPSKTVITNGGSDVVVTADRVQLNSPIELSRLKLNFPEGARVDDPASGMTHIWGADDKPLNSVSAAEFSRLEASVAGIGGSSSTQLNFWMIVLLNIAGIAAIILLGAWRRRVAAKREGAAK